VFAAGAAAAATAAPTATSATAAAAACRYLLLLLLQDDNYPDSIGNDRTAWAVQFANVAMEFLSHVQQYMTTPGGLYCLYCPNVSACTTFTALLLLTACGFCKYSVPMYAVNRFKCG
jgi:hypothetical protein